MSRRNTFSLNVFTLHFPILFCCLHIADRDFPPPQQQQQPNDFDALQQLVIDRQFKLDRINRRIGRADREIDRLEMLQHRERCLRLGDDYIRQAYDKSLRQSSRDSSLKTSNISRTGNRNRTDGNSCCSNTASNTRHRRRSRRELQISGRIYHLVASRVTVVQTAWRTMWWDEQTMETLSISKPTFVRCQD